MAHLVWATQVTRARSSKNYFVYILASKRNGTLYVGVTNDIGRRVFEHREGLVPGFTRKYGVSRLVYFEAFESVDAAIRRERIGLVKLLFNDCDVFGCMCEGSVQRQRHHGA